MDFRAFSCPFFEISLLFKSSVLMVSSFSRLHLNNLNGPQPASEKVKTWRIQLLEGATFDSQPLFFS